jgi:hypothetical protein
MRTLGWLEAGPCAAGRLETKKAGALFAAHGEIKRGNDRQAFLYKNCSIQRGSVPEKARRVSLKRTRMKVNCCWNGAHGSTMTEDRANPGCRGWPREGAQSLAGWGIQRIAKVWKEGLKVARNGPVSEFCQGSKVAQGRGQTGEKNPRTRRGFFVRLLCR